MLQCNPSLWNPLGTATSFKTCISTDRKKDHIDLLVMYPMQWFQQDRECHAAKPGDSC